MKSHFKTVFLSLAIIFVSLNLKGQNDTIVNEFKSNIIKIAIVAEDLDKTLDFYLNVIGMTKVREFTVDVESSKKFGLTGGIPFKVIGLKLKDTDDATELKIISFSEKPVKKKSRYIQDDIGVQYLTIYPTSMQPIIERIKSNNIEFLGETPTPAGENIIFVLIQDPNGVFIELIGDR